MRFCTIIPVYNNVRTIADMVQRCRAVEGSDLLVIADGSTDNSDIKARTAGAKVIKLPTNMGKGWALRHGLEQARVSGHTHAIVLDADGQHFPEDIPKFIAATQGDPDRLWVGVRNMRQNDVPKSSLRGRTISNFWATLNGWQRCRDAQCGYRSYPIEKTLALHCRENGFQFEMEVLVRASWKGLRLGHINIDVHYPKKERRISHFDKKRDNLKFTWLSFKMFLGMLVRIPSLVVRGFSRLFSHRIEV
jgi:glycosyltransferase involved in cell wall biosynthesis